MQLKLTPFAERPTMAWKLALCRMTDTNNTKLNTILSRVLNFKPEEISESTTLESSLVWDSFNALMLASALEKDFNITFASGELMKIKNVADIKNQLQKSGVKI